MSNTDTSTLQILKDWVVNGDGKHIPTKTMASEMGIKQNRLRKALRGEDDLSDCIMLVITYLRVKGVIEAQEVARRAERTVNTQASFTPIHTLSIMNAHKDDRSHLRALRERYASQCLDDTVTCHLSGDTKRIETDICITMQSNECFGCGSSVRFCKACKMRFVASPEIDLCQLCYNEEQTAEDEAAQHGIPQVHPFDTVHCLISSDDIRQDICRSMQGDEICGKCNAPSRLCTECKQRRVYYPEYGHCLACTVSQFVKKILPCHQRSDDEATLLERLRNPNTQDNETKPEQDSEPATATSSSEEEQTQAPEPIETECEDPASEISLETLASDFAAYLEAQDMRSRTIKAYRDYTEKFVDRIRELDLTFTEITEEMCNDFILLDEEGEARGRQNAGVRRAAMKKLFDWLTMEHNISLPIISATLPRRERRPTFSPTQNTPQPEEAPKPAREPDSESTNIAGETRIVDKTEQPPTTLNNEEMDEEYARLIKNAQTQEKTTLMQALQRAHARRTTTAQPSVTA